TKRAPVEPSGHASSFFVLQGLPSTENGLTVPAGVHEQPASTSSTQETGMETTRTRFGSRFSVRVGGAFEWMLAAAVVLGVLMAGSTVIDEARAVRPVMPVMALAAP